MNPDPETRRAVFHFVDGTHLTVEWPRQAPKGVFAMEAAVEKAITAPQFSVEVDGVLMVIQMANVKYFEVIPAPRSLPEMVIVGGRLTDAK